MEDNAFLIIEEWSSQKRKTQDKIKNKRESSWGLSLEGVFLWASLPKTERRQSAVIMPCVKDLDGRDAILLVEKGKNLKHHAGQMAFPGGSREKKDMTPLDTALRELEEEVGIAQEMVEVVEALPKEYVYSSDFVIYPYLAYINGDDLFDAISLDEEELASAVLVDIKKLPLPPKLRWMKTPQGVTVYPEFYLNSRRMVWGATARILWRLIRKYYMNTGELCL